MGIGHKRALKPIILEPIWIHLYAKKLTIILSQDEKHVYVYNG